MERLSPACWFAAAAGASAGAITATAIAVGLTPDEIGREAEKARAAIHKPTHVNGLRRVRNGASYLDQDSLKKWLADLLEGQVKTLSGESGGKNITFGQLHRLTDGFELNVVAVDLARQHRVVFNYALTPNCSVGSAVIASAAIPLAFESMLLSVPQRSPTGLIVDGGVLANYPAFVFRDASFRKWAGVGAYHVAWRPLASHIADVLGGDTTVLDATLGTMLSVFWALVPIYAWIVISLVLGIGSLLHRTVQVTGYGLVRTFLAGAGPPVWTGTASDDHVVRLRVPRGIDTLAVSLGPDGVTAALNAAREETRSQLRQVDFRGAARIEHA